MLPFEALHAMVEKQKIIQFSGKVDKVIGLTIEVKGLQAFVGEICEIYLPSGAVIPSEVVGFRGDSVILMPLGDLGGIMSGCQVIPTGKAMTIKVGEGMLGAVLDGLGRPLTDDFSWIQGDTEVELHRDPPNPLLRRRIDEVLGTGIRAIDAFLTCGRGQRIGVFAGSGVGKSTLLGMISRYSDAEINVIALIGERGREIKDFIEKDLGPEGLARSILICATSDQPPLVRLKGAFLATAIAEHFRDQGKNVMLLMDSVTRFAMAQREVGLAAGEAPATKGYTPSVFALLPKLLERGGTAERGSITAFYTVLVEGDDMNEPIADAVRGILDGHIVLSRDLAARHHYPAIDIGQSISRLMNELISEDHAQNAAQARHLMSVYKEAEDLIQIGAYKAGTSFDIDRAIALKADLDRFLKQETTETTNYASNIEALRHLSHSR